MRRGRFSKTVGLTRGEGVMEVGGERETIIPMATQLPPE